MSYMDAEVAIIERYQQKVSARIYSAEELAGIEEEKQTAPSVHVLYYGSEPSRSIAGGAVQEIIHTWMTVVCVKAASQRNQGEAKRRKASELLDMVIEASIGWRPGAGHTPLQLAPSPAPAYSPGFAYFPLAFTTKTQHRGVA
jgi:hypothetical protein